MGIAWIIGFTIYFRKRYKRKKLKRQIAAGKAVRKHKPSKIPEENIIIPPDPAILLGHRLPGEPASQGDNHNNRQHDQHRLPDGAPPVMRTSEEMAIPPKT